MKLGRIKKYSNRLRAKVKAGSVASRTGLRHYDFSRANLVIVSLIVAGIGSYILLPSSAATQTKVWDTDTELNGGVLSNTVVSGTGTAAKLQLAPATPATEYVKSFLTDYSHFTPADYSRYSYILVNRGASDDAICQAYHTANPTGKCLLYVLLSSVTTYSTTLSGGNSGIACGDLTSHPDWLLTTNQAAPSTLPACNSNSSTDNTTTPNNLVKIPTYPEYQIDPGNTTFRSTWINNVNGLLNAHPNMNGIFTDNTFIDATYAFIQNYPNTKYPNNAAWQAALEPFVSQISTSMHGRNKLYFANVSGDASSQQQKRIDWYNAYFDGMLTEAFMRPNNDPASATMRELLNGLTPYAWNQAYFSWNNEFYGLVQTQQNQADKVSLLRVPAYSNDITAARYGMGTMLLASTGRTAISTQDNYSSENYYSQVYTEAKGLGAPSGSYQRLSNGIYQRDFTKGIVLVNPQSSSQSFTLSSGTYSGSGLNSASGTISLPAGTALFLKPDNTSNSASGTAVYNFDAGQSVSWTTLTDSQTTPTGTTVALDARSSSDNSTWSAWVSASNIASLSANRYIQVRATLNTTDTSQTPSIDSISLGYATALSSSIGDANLDGHVNITDLSVLLSHYATAYAPCDFNTDGTVNVVDLSILLSHYGT